MDAATVSRFLFAVLLLLGSSFQVFAQDFEKAESFYTDPGWVSFNLPNGPMTFGYSITQNADGLGIGEAGGLFSQRVTQSYYADRSIGTFAAGAPVHASGVLYFGGVQEGYDNNIFVGFFRADSIESGAFSGLGLQVLENGASAFRVFRLSGTSEGLVDILDIADSPTSWRFSYNPFIGSYGVLSISIGEMDGYSYNLSSSDYDSLDGYDSFGIVTKKFQNRVETASFYIDDLLYSSNTPVPPTPTPDCSQSPQPVQVSVTSTGASVLVSWGKASVASFSGYSVYRGINASFVPAYRWTGLLWVLIVGIAFMTWRRGAIHTGVLSCIVVAVLAKGASAGLLELLEEIPNRSQTTYQDTPPFSGRWEYQVSVVTSCGDEVFSGGVPIDYFAHYPTPTPSVTATPTESPSTPTPRPPTPTRTRTRTPTPSYCEPCASPGACSGHMGVNCAAGPDSDGSVICNDGWRDSMSDYHCG